MKLSRKIPLFFLTLFMAAGTAGFRQGEDLSFLRTESRAALPDFEENTLMALNAATSQKARSVKDIPITLLFFNDLHGNLEPFTIKKQDGTSLDVGGIAGLATVVKQIRAENTGKGTRTFLLVAGDVLQGTPMSTVFQGTPDVEALNLKIGRASCRERV
jgi:2',3'-cyclic-nucleotide 2'-phosphodiesterase (5'-nucleotidase family)